MEITDDDLKELLEAAKGMFNGSLSRQPGEWIKGSVGVNKPTKGETRWEV